MGSPFSHHPARNSLADLIGINALQRYLPVREAAACSVCVFIRHNKKVEQRTEMCNRIIQGSVCMLHIPHLLAFSVLRRKSP